MDQPIFSTVGHLTNLAARGFVRLSEARLKPLGIGPGQVPIMVALSKGGANTQRDLSQLLQVEQPPMAQMLARMERSGLIERHADPGDGRSSLILLTDLARENLPAALQVVVNGNQDATNGFSDDERALLVALLKRLIQNLKSIAMTD